MSARAMRSALVALAAIACLATTIRTSAQGPPNGAALPVLHVQRSVHMLVTPAGNIAVQVGDEGVLLVDSATAALAPQVIAAVRTLSNKPLHTIITTNLHNAGGNIALVQSRGTGATQPVRVIAHEKVLDRLVAARPAGSSGEATLKLNAVIELPINSAYFTESRDFFLNGESVVIYHVPAAHTDGDSLVHFRVSDVLAVGDIFSPDRFPFIDIENGGSVQGLIAALNRTLELTVPAKFQEGGTYVIPAHGRLCDEADVVEYRDMVTIVRDRVQDLIKKGRTLEQVKSAKPSGDYDSAYDAKGGVSPDRFVESVYRSLRK
jgi:glyoxylase-like metal-dependent hydrolase (beta-lactamase superfamily II)